MSSETPPAGGLATLVQYRRQVAIGLVVAGVVLAAVAVWWTVRGWPSREDPAKAAQAPELKLDGETPEDKGPQREYSADYLPGAVWAGGLALLCFGSAGWLATQPVAPGTELSTIRGELLSFGSLAGLLTAFLGLVLGLRWQDSLFKWVNDNDPKEARWVLIAGCVLTIGLILMFASLQLARAEERANANLRRLLYGFNAVFLGLLLFVVLVALNVVSFLYVPTTLVTNDAAFTELSEPSKNLLRSLDRPVKVYLMLPEKYTQEVQTRSRPVGYDRLYSDCRGLLTECEEHSRHFKAEYLSPGLDAARIAAVLERHKVKRDERDREQFGMLVAVGENEEAVSFINAVELLELVPISRTAEIPVFQGENRLMTELAYLTADRSNEVVYFTQGHDEVGLEPGAGAGRTMGSIAQFLRDKKVRFEPLTINESDPKVPADAGVVVIAGPQRFIAPDSPTYKALRDYLRPPTPDRKPGKVLAFLPAAKGVKNEVTATGLEPLFADLGVQVAPDRRIVMVPGQFPLGRTQDGRVAYVPPDTTVGVVYDNLTLPLKGTLSESPLLFQNARSIRVAPTPTGSLRTHLLLGTPRGAGHWQEGDWQTQAVPTWTAMRNDRELATRKEYSSAQVPVAVAVTEPPPPGGDAKKGDRPRAIVFASDTPLLDRPDGLSIPEELRQLVFADCVDWLREREANLGIPPRKSATFTVGKPPDLMSLLTLLAMMVVGTAALGVGVWLSRRR